MKQDYLEGALGCMNLVGFKILKKEYEKAKTQAANTANFLATANEPELSRKAGKIVAYIEKGETEEALNIQREILGLLLQEENVHREEKRQNKGHVAVVKKRLSLPKMQER